MTKFYTEAAWLWDLEAGTSSLTRIQAGICLCKHNHFYTSLHLFSITNRSSALDLFLGKVGRDKCGHVFLVEACRMSEELGLFSKHSSYAKHLSASVPQDRWDVVRAVTAWALFNFQL
jgi:hypothetical protein